jgi:hypothetical protein
MSEWTVSLQHQIQDLFRNHPKEVLKAILDAAADMPHLVPRRQHVRRSDKDGGLIGITPTGRGNEVYVWSKPKWDKGGMSQVFASSFSAESRYTGLALGTLVPLGMQIDEERNPQQHPRPLSLRVEDNN